MVNQLKIENAQTTNYDSLEETAIDAKYTDGVSNQPETTWMNDKWPKYWGAFCDNADLKSAILLKAIWTVGKGYQTEDSMTKSILEIPDETTT